ncbi:MAG: MltA domain-containing protein, partial [Campylobacterales bacterium]|nr:MltA domain-containing protein [Campylobacterales bacterium]
AVSFFVSAQVLKAEEQLTLHELMQNEMSLFDQNAAKEQRNNVPLLEKLDSQNVNLSRIFTIDLRHDENFLRAIDGSIQFYTNILDTSETFQYGHESYSPLQMLHSLILFRKMLAKDRPYEEFLLELKQHFDVYQPKSNDSGSKFTGYYTPEIQASPTKTKQLNYPLYLSHSKVKASKPDFYVQSRKDIKALEMEGAGILSLNDGGTLNLQYAGRKTVLDKILAKKIKVVKKTVRVNGKKYVKVLKVKRQPETKAVFYIADNGPLGALSTQLVPGYSAAMDMDLTPSGSLIYIKSNDNSTKNTKSEEDKKTGFESFMLVHDTGGAIKGPGRVDIYCGEGSNAKNCTYNVSSRGSVYLLVAKKESLLDFSSE